MPYTYTTSFGGGIILAPCHSDCCPPHVPWRASAAERFLAHTLITDECWIWQGGRKKAGYGQFAVGGRKVIAHRWSYMHHVGPIPDGHEIDHLCRNKRCVRPDHLEAVPLAENRARRNAAKTHCNWGHEYAPDNTRWAVDGDGYRVRFCRACDVRRGAEARARRAAA